MPFREFKDNNSGVGLRGHGFAQFQNGFAPHNFALALNDRQFTHGLNGYIQHLLPPKCLVPVHMVVCTWSTGDGIVRKMSRAFRGGAEKVRQETRNSGLQLRNSYLVCSITRYSPTLMIGQV